MRSIMYQLVNLPGRVKRDKNFFSKLIKFGLPLALQNLVSTSLNMVDTLMIGQRGETAIASVALSNQIYFLLILLIFGISSGTAVFTAQFWGKGDREGIHRSQGISLLLGMTGAGIFTLAAQIAPEEILGFFTKDQMVISAAVPYLRITSVSYIFTAVTFIFQGVLRSIGVVRLPLYLSVSALSLNAFFNYSLIFGKFGMPELGIIGAALATSGARTVEMGVLVAVIYIRKYPIAANFRQLANQNIPFFKQYMGKVFPVILNEVGWSMGMTMFTLVYARMGTAVLAAYNITDTFSRLAFVLFAGSANAAAIVLGNMIGEGRRKEADRCARTMLAVVPIMTLAFSVMILLMAPVVPRLFKISESSSFLILQFMRIFALFLLLKTSNMHIIVGLLRSGGDTHFCMILELIPLWFVSLPLMAFCGLVLHWPPAAVYITAMSEELIKYIIGVRRILSGKWVHDLTG